MISAKKVQLFHNAECVKGMGEAYITGQSPECICGVEWTARELARMRANRKQAAIYLRMALGFDEGDSFTEYAKKEIASLVAKLEEE